MDMVMEMDICMEKEMEMDMEKEMLLQSKSSQPILPNLRSMILL